MNAPLLGFLATGALGVICGGAWALCDRMLRLKPPAPIPCRSGMLEELRAILGDEVMSRVTGAEWALRMLKDPAKVRVAIDAWWKLSQGARESFHDPDAYLVAKFESLRRLGEAVAAKRGGTSPAERGAA